MSNTMTEDIWFSKRSSRMQTGRTSLSAPGEEDAEDTAVGEKLDSNTKQFESAKTRKRTNRR